MIAFMAVDCLTGVLHVQATVETVIKVSGNKRQEPEPEPVEEPPAAPAPPPAVLEPESTLESIIHHSWGHRHDRKEVPEVRLRHPS